MQNISTLYAESISSAVKLISNEEAPAASPGMGL